MNTEDSEFERIEREQAMRGIPDAIHHTDTSEPLMYIKGWNDCRQAMLAEQPAPAAQQEPVPTECRRDGRCQYAIDNGIEGLSLGFPQPAPVQGWKLVPAQPTDQMRDAGNIIIGDRGALFAAYQAMIAAAPQAQPAREPTKAMIDAAERIDWSDSDVCGNIVNMWQAMCAVAPQAPKENT